MKKVSKKLYTERQIIVLMSVISVLFAAKEKYYINILKELLYRRIASRPGFKPGTLVSSDILLPPELSRQTGLTQFTHNYVSTVLRTTRIVAYENTL